MIVIRQLYTNSLPVKQRLWLMVCWLISAARRSAPYEKAALFSQKTVNKQDEVIGTTACLCLSDGDDDDGAPHWITVDSASTSSFLLPLQPFHHFRTGAVNQCIVATYFLKKQKLALDLNF
ncbi:hypothetical protein XENOCAPTIV_002726 [Xenoophorus captivus]|uniref:Uncharacterized protein n=1 Tax=Xenoophorus captivus TaxID=1517983 RepID=A0ABV0Q7M5_9TELE